LGWNAPRKCTVLTRSERGETVEISEERTTLETLFNVFKLHRVCHVFFPVQRENTSINQDVCICIHRRILRNNTKKEKRSFQESYKKNRFRGES
jgi:hypothetical protein